MDPPPDLTLPEPGSTTMRQVLGEYLKDTLSTLLRLPAGRFHQAASDDLFQVRQLLRRLLAGGDAGAVFAVLRRPTVSTLVRCIERELYAGGDVDRLDAWLSELSATIAWELFAAGTPDGTTLTLRRPPERVLSLGGRVEAHLGQPASLTFARSRVVVTPRSGDAISIELAAELAPGARDTRGSSVTLSGTFFDVQRDLRLALADNNPLSSEEAHPDKAGNAIDLGDATPEQWSDALRSAYDLTERYLPDLAMDMGLVMQMLVPVGTSDETHLSASYAEAIGIAYVSLHPDPMTMVEALVHESAHNRLNAFLRLDPVLDNAHSTGHVSPVRPDPRPLLGILLAAHAFVPVARLYELMIEGKDPLAGRSGFAERYRQIVNGNHDAIETLVRLGAPTARGQAVLDELRRWDAHFAPERADQT